MANGNLAVTGSTRLLAIIGDPVDHLKAPRMINTRLAEYGLADEAVLVPMRVKPEGLSAVLSALRALSNFRGAVITMPHKVSIVPFLDEIVPEAKQLGACNVIRRDPDGQFVGAMFDGEGMVKGLQKIGQDVKGKRVFLVGAGGVAAGIAFAVAKYGARSLTVSNRTQAKAEALVARLRQARPDFTVNCGDAKGVYDVVINATSLGMKDGDPLPIPLEMLSFNTVVADVVTQSEITPFIAAARERGCKVQPGKGMLTTQINLMIEFMLNESLDARLARSAVG